MEFPSYFRHVRTPTPESNVPTQISETRGLKTIARKIPSQRWEFTFNGFTYNGSCNGVSNNDSIRFFGEFVAAAENGFGVFDYKPHDKFLMGAVNSQLYDTPSAGDDTFRISIASGIANPDSVVMPGKMFKFSTDDKAYMIRSAEFSFVNGPQRVYDVKIHPPLFKSQALFTSIISDSNMRIKLRVDGGTGRGVTSDVVRDKTVYQFKMIEVI